MTSLSHRSDRGRRRHAMKIAAGPLLIPPAALQGAGVPVPRPRCGGEPRHRLLRGRGVAANLKLGASTGALRREIDHYSCQALGLSRGHSVSPFVNRLPVATTNSDRRITGAEILFEFGASHD